MAIQVQIRRGTTSENNAFTGASGEITCDTEAHTLRIHDGTTAGGFVVDQSANVVHKAGNQSEEINGTKTFIASPYVKKDSPQLTFINNEVDLLNPIINNTSTYSSINYVDSTRKELGYCRHTYKTTNNINYSNIELIAIDPDPTHYNNRIVSTNNIIYIQSGDDDTNRVRRWKQENTTTIFYTPYTGTISDPIKQPVVGSDIYSDIACQTVVDTIAQVGSTRLNSTLTLEAKGGTERSAYLNFNPSANSSTSSTQLPTIGWCNDYQLSTNLVHRDGTETITGSKIFTYWPDVKCTTNARTDTANYMAAYRITDKNDKAIGEFASKGDIYGNKFITLHVCKDNNGADEWYEVFSGGIDPSNNTWLHLHGKNLAMFISTFWKSGNSWYKKYNNNWVEQGGVITGSNPWVGFNIAMSPDFILVSGLYQYAGERTIQLYPADGTTTGFRLYNRNENQTTHWYGSGYAA